MLVNLANAHSMRSEYDKALGILQRAAPLLGAKQNLPQVVLLAVYVHLLNGGDGMSTVVKVNAHLLYFGDVLSVFSATVGRRLLSHFSSDVKRSFTTVTSGVLL